MAREKRIIAHDSVMFYQQDIIHLVCNKCLKPLKLHQEGDWSWEGSCCGIAYNIDPEMLIIRAELEEY